MTGACVNQCLSGTVRELHGALKIDKGSHLLQQLCGWKSTPNDQNEYARLNNIVFESIESGKRFFSEEGTKDGGKCMSLSCMHIRLELG